MIFTHPLTIAGQASGVTLHQSTGLLMNVDKEDFTRFAGDVESEADQSSMNSHPFASERGSPLPQNRPKGALFAGQHIEALDELEVFPAVGGETRRDGLSLVVVGRGMGLLPPYSRLLCFETPAP